MKVGKRTHLDLGSIAGAVLIFLGALPEIITDPSVKAALPAKWTPILLIVGAVLGAMRGRAVRVEQYRADDVVKAAVTGELPASVKKDEPAG